ncbi:MAG: hypothetical protein AAGD43_26945 [Pseudomonadota bacterium]
MGLRPCPQTLDMTKRLRLPERFNQSKLWRQAAAAAAVKGLLMCPFRNDQTFNHVSSLKCILVISAFFAFSLVIPSTFAQENDVKLNSYPQISGNIIFRMANDTVYDSTTPVDRSSVFVESKDTFFETIASPIVHFSKRLSINSELRLEGVRPPSEDRTFEDQGIFVRKLFAEFSASEHLSFHAGKITPSFALASFVAAGMYGINYSKEIELIERIGFGAAYAFDFGVLGKHTLTGSTFFEDTSILSDSLLSRRGQTRLSDGGASNTETFESFTLSLEGTNIKWLPGFTYKLGYVHEAKGQGDVADEDGFAIAASQAFRLRNGQSVFLFGEIAPLLNFEGSADDILYSSAGLVYQSGPWNMILSGTHRLRDLAAGGTNNDYSLQTAIKYDFGDDISFEVAHEFIRDQNVDSRRVGFRFIKVLELGR